MGVMATESPRLLASSAEPDPWLARPAFLDPEPPEAEPPDGDVVLAFVEPVESPRTARPAADRPSWDAVFLDTLEPRV